MLVVERPVPDLDAADLTSLAERIQGRAQIAHRKVIVTGDADGARTTAGFEAAAYVASRLVVMVRRRPLDRTVALDGFAERDAASLQEARVEFLKTEPYGQDEDSRREILAYDARQAGVRRAFTVTVGGRVAAMCQVITSGGVATIDDVGTLPEFRGRGLSRRLLQGTLAAVEADTELVFLEADEDDWPRELYARMGFDVIGRVHQFLRLP